MQIKKPELLRGRWLQPSAPLALAVLALALGGPDARAQATPNPPELMTYQGFLTDGNGVALGNAAPRNYDVIFRLYNHENDAAPASLLWSEQQTLTVDKGYFSVLLGEGAQVGSEPRPVLSGLFKGASASDRYVGITVKGIGPGGANVDILPRLRLMSAPYAFLSQQAVKLVQDTGADLISANGNNVTIVGPVAATSFAGDGTGLSGVAKLNGGNVFNGDQFMNNRLGVGDGSPDRPLSVRADAGSQLLTFKNNAGNARWHANLSGGSLNWAETGVADGRLFLEQGGNVGINTTDPAHTLHVNGSIGITGFNVLEFGTGVAKEFNAGKIGYNTFSGFALDIVGAGTSGGNRRVQAWAEGGFGINGPLSASSFSCGGGIDVGSIHTGGQLTTGNYISANGGMQELRDWGMRTKLPSDTSRFVDWWRHANGFSFSMYGGNRFNSGSREVQYDGDSNWDFYSDRKLKKDIVDAEPMLDRALKVQIRRYRWREEDETAKHKLGVIAQEVQPLFPDLVSQSEDRETKEPLLSVGYSDFGMVAIKALQEFKAQHDAEMADLKAQVAAMKAQMAEVLQANAELRSRSESRAVVAVGQ